ncbi:NAD(P)/FAD-dependent oxidoreductase, partial [Xanthomonas citri]
DPPQLKAAADLLGSFPLIASGTEGYRTAEVTLGGVDTHQVSSATMESRLVAGLYFVGEVLDVTGWLGGYNFQWAWASGHAAGSVA